MKKIITLIAVLAVAGMAQASLISINANFQTGSGVYEYTDGDSDSGGVFNTGFTLYIINSSAVDASLVDGMLPAELSAVTDTAIASGALFIKDSGFGQKVSTPAIANIVVPDSTDVYSILVNDLGNFAMVLDAPTNVGVFDPAAAYTPTQAIPATNSTIAMGTQDWLAVVPEPATIGLMGIAGIGMFLARRKIR